MSNLGNKKVMAKNIQYYMDKNNKTRNDMCTALGVKYTTFTDWVKGNTYPRIDKIELMSNYFGISKSDLVEEHNKEHSLNQRDKRDIAKDLDEIMAKIENDEDGPLRYNGEEIDEHSRELLRNAIELGLTQVKAINKELYNPNKNKKR